MIVLDFQVDEGVLAEDAAEAPAGADPATLEQTYFILPIRFTVNGTELLGSGAEGGWEALPLLGFATALRSVIEELADKEHARMFLAGGGELRWERLPDAPQVNITSNRHVVAADAEALRVAVGEFVERVRSFLEARFPEIHGHPYWPSWFRAAPDFSA